MEHLTDDQCRQLKKYLDTIDAEHSQKLVEAARVIGNNTQFTNEDVLAISRIMALLLDGSYASVLEDVDPFPEDDNVQYLARIKKTSEYSDQDNGQPFHVELNYDHPSYARSGYIWKGGPGGRYRSRDITLFVRTKGELVKAF